MKTARVHFLGLMRDARRAQRDGIDLIGVPRDEQGKVVGQPVDDIGLLGLPALPEPMAHKVAPTFHSLPTRCTFFPTVPVPPFSPSISSLRTTSFSERISLFTMRIFMIGPNWLEIALRI